MSVSSLSIISSICPKDKQYFFNKLDRNVAMSCFALLSNEDLSIMIRVCRVWHDMKGMTEEIGKKRCQLLKLYMPLKINHLTFKRLAASPRGNVYLDTAKVSLYQHDTMNGPLRWKDAALHQLFVAVIIYNQESIDEYLDKSPGTTKLEKGNGSWQNSYSRIPNKRFPVWIPFRFFIKKDGKLAGNGDRINLIYQNQPILLNCTPGPTIVNFASELARRLQQHQSLLLRMEKSFIKMEKFISDAQNHQEEWVREDIHFLESSESSK